MASDPEMQAAFDAAFGELGVAFVDAPPPQPHSSAALTAAEAELLGTDGDAPTASFAAMLASAMDAEVSQQRERRREHVEQLLAPMQRESTERLAPATCAEPLMAGPVAMAVTPPRAVGV